MSAFSASPSQGQVYNYLQVNRYVAGFYSPFAGSFLLKSTEALLPLTESFRGLFEDQPYSLVEFLPANMNGTLPAEIWQWLHYGFVPPPPPPVTLPSSSKAHL